VLSSPVVVVVVTTTTAASDVVVVVDSVVRIVVVVVRVVVNAMMCADVALLRGSHTVVINVVVVVVLCFVASSPGPVTSRSLATQMSPYVVETQYGRLRGVLVALPAGVAATGRPSQSRSKTVVVEAFLGLQYASLLGGELRFMPPTSSMEKWDGVRPVVVVVVVVVAVVVVVEYRSGTVSGWRSSSVLSVRSEFLT